MAREIPLTKGYVAIVDDEDFERINAHKWNVLVGNSGVVYGQRTTCTGGKKRTLLLHREVMGHGPGDPQIDHRDGDGRNCQKSNLREATHKENAHNCRVARANNTSGYKGVAWDKQAGKWQANICFDGRMFKIGYYATPIEAAHAYDRAARELHGEFARLNFPDAATLAAD